MEAGVGMTEIFKPSKGGSFTAYRVECKFPDSDKWVPAKIVRLDCPDIGAATPFPEEVHVMLDVYGYEQAMSFAYQVLSRARSGNVEQRTRHMFAEVRVIPYIVQYDLKSECSGDPIIVHGRKEL